MISTYLCQGFFALTAVFGKVMNPKFTRLNLAVILNAKRLVIIMTSLLF